MLTPDIINNRADNKENWKLFQILADANSSNRQVFRSSLTKPGTQYGGFQLILHNKHYNPAILIEKFKALGFIVEKQQADFSGLNESEYGTEHSLVHVIWDKSKKVADGYLF